MADYDPFEERLRAAAQTLPHVSPRWERVVVVARRRRRRRLITLLTVTGVSALVIAAIVLASKSAVDPTFTPPLTVLQVGAPAVSSSFSPDGRTLASGNADGRIVVLDARTSRSVALFRGHTAAVASVAFSPDGRTLASGSADRTVRLWGVPASPHVQPAHR